MNGSIIGGAAMKVGVVTFHFVNNFGGVLQAYALQRMVAEQCGVESIIINYKNWFIRFTDTVRLFPISLNRKEIIAGIKTMRDRFGRIRKFNEFINSDFNTSDFYANHIQINAHPPRCDKYICGSDQIWNPYLTMGVSPNYFLDFVKDPQQKIAYAPSFGTEKISKRHIKKIKKYLETFGYLSVREKSGQEMIKEMIGRDADRLIDPTFLIEKKVWEEIAIQPIKEEKYILLYIMQHDEAVYKYAKKIKEQMGLKLVEISRYGFKPDYVDVTLIDVGPREFLGLFRDAEYICTNSYHGLAFSIIFEKNFCLIPCKRFKARIENLLDLLQIETDGNSWERLTATYDREFVKQTIAGEKEKAIDYLKRGLELNEEKQVNDRNCR